MLTSAAELGKMCRKKRFMLNLLEKFMTKKVNGVVIK
ncbi:hypothetical protein DFO73_101812 [Cytobacillus oceanisediminis]|jgi:hypothetical protein|uniref:Uncharacterized protein n=1 Tax=Cytobacillus oceanisediminis TaxID=665099 RepID=A0A2V3A651_9BACI|nr:hypothetical protein DFO73_101812 [Cytobacillus oceanisediminis]